MTATTPVSTRSDSDITPGRTLLIACGALAHEIVAVLRANRWEHVDVECLPAHWHNTPEHIVPGVEAKIVAAGDAYEQILVAYGDCGTGGRLDTVLAKHGVERLPGDHCYAFFAGQSRFDELADAELGTFYLTDYLAANFKRLIFDGMGINKHPELRDLLFGNYTRVVYLAQQPASEEGLTGDRIADAEEAARLLELPLVVEYTGLAPLSRSLKGINIAAA